MLNQDLFSDTKLAYAVEIPDGELFLYPHFFTVDEADRYYQQLLDQIKWQQETIQMYGKQLKVPRLTAWYGEQGKAYTYSGIHHDALAWIGPLLEIKSRIESVAVTGFNSVLLNLYRDGNDGVAWHSDDEPELGPQPVIASVSFGEARVFQLRHKHNHAPKKNLLLPHGSLLIMRGNTQSNWLHQIAKSKKPMGPRINLTFRAIV